MTEGFAAAMLRALAQTHAQNLHEATATIMAALGKAALPTGDSNVQDGSRPIDPGVIEAEYRDLTAARPPQKAAGAPGFSDAEQSLCASL